MSVFSKKSDDKAKIALKEREEKLDDDMDDIEDKVNEFKKEIDKLEKHIAEFEASVKFYKSSIDEKNKEIFDLQKKLYENTTFMQTVIMELIKSKAEISQILATKPAVSPAVSAYLAKKEGNAGTNVSKLP